MGRHDCRVDGCWSRSGRGRAGAPPKAEHLGLLVWIKRSVFGTHVARCAVWSGRIDGRLCGDFDVGLRALAFRESDSTRRSRGSVLANALGIFAGRWSPCVVWTVGTFHARRWRPEPLA